MEKWVWRVRPAGGWACFLVVCVGFGLVRVRVWQDQFIICNVLVLVRLPWEGFLQTIVPSTKFTL